MPKKRKPKPNGSDHHFVYVVFLRNPKGDGHTSREIADMLVISPRTVERHRENLRHKLGLRNRVDLTRYAIRSGLIAP